MNESVRKLFIEQPLALPGSAKKRGQLGEKVGEKVEEKTGEKVGESLGEIDKLNLCQFCYQWGYPV